MKKQKRRWISLILAIGMMLGMMPTNAFAAGNAITGAYYMDAEDGQIPANQVIKRDDMTIKSYSGDRTMPFYEIVVPEGTEKVYVEYTGFGFTGVGDYTKDGKIGPYGQLDTKEKSPLGVPMDGLLGTGIVVALYDNNWDWACAVQFSVAEDNGEPNVQSPIVTSEGISLSMKLNEWEDIDLSQYFSDPQGDELTYQVSYDNENWTPVANKYAYYPAGDGEQVAYFKATDSNGNVSEVLTLTADVLEAPNEVTVELSIKDGPSKFYTVEETDKVMVPTTITVPYFDLALYGLEDYYYNPQCYITHKEGDSEYDNNQLVGTKETAEGVVTAMHVFIYATEIYYLGYDAKNAGTGASYEAGEFQEAVSWTGGVGSSYMNLWDHGTNLNYYVDWKYPVGAYKWGSTSDQIALYGGEEIVIHMIESSNAYGSDFTFFTLDGTYSPESKADEVNAVQEDKIELTSVITIPDYDEFTTEYKANADKAVYYAKASGLTGNLRDEDCWTMFEDAYTDKDGKVILDTTGMDAGEYYIAAEGIYDRNGGTECGPAVIKLNLQKKPQEIKITLTQDKNEDEVVTVQPVNTGKVYENTYVYFAELPEFGNFLLDDDYTKVRSRIYTGNSSLTMPIQTNLSYNTSTKEEIEAKYGEIEGLDSENTIIQLFEMREFKRNQYNRYETGDLIYVLVTEVPITRVDEVKLDKAELELKGGESYKFTATVSPDKASYPTITWKSSDTDVVEVASDGSIIAYKEGEAVITATADGVSASCTVTVTSSYPKPTQIYSGTEWPYAGGGITKASVNGIAVKEYKWIGSNCYVVLDEGTPDDAQGYIGLNINGGAIAYADGVQVTDNKVNIALEDGDASYAIKCDYSDWATTTKTIHLSNDYHDIAPFLTGSASANYLMAEGDTYSLDLTPLFKDYSEHGMTYTVAVDGEEAVSAKEAYEYVGNIPGKHTLVFTANNTVGDSPVYTVTLKVVPKEAICEINKVGANGSFDWVAFTDENLNYIEGISVDYDAENRTFDVTLPANFDMAGKVTTFYKLTQNAKGEPLITGSTAHAGVPSGTWSGQIRTEQTNTLVNGKTGFTVYYYDRKPTGHYDNANEPFKFSFERLRPETSFEHVVDSGMPGYLSKVISYGDEGSVNGYSWYAKRELHIALGEDTPDDAKITITANGTEVSGNGSYKLVDGTYTHKITVGPWYEKSTNTVIYKKDNLPTLAKDVETTAKVSIPCLSSYELDLSTIFADVDDEDTMTYQVKVDDGAWENVAEANYSYVPQSATDYTLEFRAFDGFVYSEDIYTVTITATNAKETYDVTVNNLPENAKFYCNIGFDEDGTDILGEEIVAEYDSENGSYTVKVPVNVSRISMVCGDNKMAADVSKDNETNVINITKVTFEILTKAGDAAEGTVEVFYGDGRKVSGEDKIFYLIPGEGYTYKVNPGEGFTEEWVSSTLEAQTVTTDEVVTLQFNVKSPKTITIDEEADVTVYYQRGYYVMSEVEPVMTVNNGDGTITYTYSAPKANAYSMGYMYFATNGDLIDKAGYLMGVNDTVITWDDDERKNDHRVPYNVNYGQGSRGDDSVLVNINSRNHLILNEGDTFRLRAFRIWEIINTDTENVMIEPQFIYSGYDKNIISMVTANEALTTQVCGTGGNNWMDLTVEGKGVTFLEVGYEAIHLVNGYEAGAWGGAGAANSDDTFNASDPARNALIVVQTDGMAATDVKFGIDCLSSNVDGNFYEKKKAVEWDAEFDTVYFIDEYGQITLKPSVLSGAIASVDISSDKGNTWSSLTADENGVYTANIYSGNNIIRVTKTDGTTAYQIVRGDKVSYELTVVNDLNGNGKANAGDTVRVTFDGLHNPIGKMSGIYNPGFSQGQRITYTWNGANAQQSGYYQYDFVSNAWIEVTIPEDADGSYSLTDGYINFNVFGDGPGNHRNLQDFGREVNTSAATTKYTRCLLPDILVYESVILGDVNEDGEIDSMDANMVNAYYYGSMDLTDSQLNAADVNADGEVDSLDANLIISLYYGNIESFE